MTVFVDASAWIALTNRRDERHNQAASLLDQLHSRKTAPHHEQLDRLRGGVDSQARVGYTAMRTLWERLADHAYVRMVADDAEVERAAIDLFLRYADKTWGIVDCASFVIMEHVACRHAFAFDQHFVEAGRQRGFEVLGAVG